MLTLKLQNKSSGRTTIVECVSVDVVPNGDGVHLCAETPGINYNYTVKSGGDYDVAFIENAAGATTQIVRPSDGNASRPRQTNR